MTFHQTFPTWSRGREPGDHERDAIEGHVGRSPAVNRLESAVEGGLAFYWLLADAASETAGHADAVVTFGDPVTQRSSPAGGGEATFPPAAPVSLDVDIPAPAGGDEDDGDRELSAFTRRVASLVMQEQTRRTLRCGRNEARALEVQVAHDIRALLQPLLLHVDQLRRNGSPSDESLELLDDLTSGLVQWVEEELEGGGLRREDRFSSPTEPPGTNVGHAVEEALEGKARDNLTTQIDDALPELHIDHRFLEAALLELIRMGTQVTRELRVEPAGDEAVRLRIQFDMPPENVAPREPPPREGDHPPVTGALLNLVAWTNGSVRLETGGGTAGRIVVRLPTAAPSSSGGGP